MEKQNNPSTKNIFLNEGCFSQKWAIVCLFFVSLFVVLTKNYLNMHQYRLEMIENIAFILLKDRYSAW